MRFMDVILMKIHQQGHLLKLVDYLKMWMLRLRLLHSANNSELRVSIKPSYAGYNVNYIAWGGIYMLLGKKFFVIFLLSIYFIYFLSFNILACEISGFIKGIDNINNRLKIDGYWYNINKGTKIY